MPRSQAAAVPPPPADPDPDLLAAEQAVASEEATLAREIHALETSSSELAARLHHVKSLASQLQLAGLRDPAFARVQKRLPQHPPERPDLDGPRKAALEARRRAIEARREAARALRQRLAAYAGELSKASDQLAQDEAALTLFRKQLEARQAEIEKMQREARLEAAAPTQQAPTIARATPPATPRPRATPRPQVPARARGPSRLRLQAVLDQASDSNFFVGFSDDVREGGVFVASLHPLPPGTEVDLTFTVAGRTLQAPGVVRWVRVANARTKDALPGIGVGFQKLSPEATQHIARFVATREPLFFPD